MTQARGWESQRRRGAIGGQCRRHTRADSSSRVSHTQPPLPAGRARGAQAAHCPRTSLVIRTKNRRGTKKRQSSAVTSSAPAPPPRAPLPRVSASPHRSSPPFSRRLFSAPSPTAAMSAVAAKSTAAPHVSPPWYQVLVNKVACAGTPSSFIQQQSSRRLPYSLFDCVWSSCVRRWERGAGEQVGGGGDNRRLLQHVC